MGDNDCHVDAICVNTIGSYNCTCGQKGGEYFEGNGTYCEEVCPPDHCGAKENCVSDGKGGWECECKPGYERVIKSCEGW